MKKRVFLAAGVAVLSAAVLAACSSGNANKEANKPVTYAYVFSSDPSTLDYTVSGNVSTKQVTGNVIDGLLENDQYGNLVPSVAEDWTVSKDGLTYTYKIRQGIKWYTNEGEEYGSQGSRLLDWSETRSRQEITGSLSCTGFYQRIG